MRTTWRADPETAVPIPRSTLENEKTPIETAPPLIAPRDAHRRHERQRRATPKCRPPLLSGGQETEIVTIGLHPMLPAASTARERIW